MSRMVNNTVLKPKCIPRFVLMLREIDPVAVIEFHCPRKGPEMAPHDLLPRCLMESFLGFYLVQ